MFFFFLSQSRRASFNKAREDDVRSVLSQQRVMIGYRFFFFCAFLCSKEIKTREYMKCSETQVLQGWGKESGRRNFFFFFVKIDGVRTGLVAESRYSRSCRVPSSTRISWLIANN